MDKTPQNFLFKQEVGAFLEESFFRNIIIMLYITYIIVISINNNNNIVINNNYGKLRDLNLFYKFPWARERGSSKFINNLDTHPQKGSPALV